MASYNHSHFNCNNTVTQLFNQSSSSLPDDLQNLMHFCVMGYESQANEKFSKPLVWIGVYIAIASLFGTVAMGADIFYRLLVKDIVPGKYFSLNAASITVISIAMKLSLDMTGSMPGVLDQVAKLGSLAFMCTMMANLIPSLASMDNKALVENIIGLAILVITIIGNISIEIYTGVIGDHMGSGFRTCLVAMAFWYVAMMLLLLLVSTSTAIIIPRTKEILKYKYDVIRKVLNDRRGLQNQATRFSSEVSYLEEYLKRYWVMAKSGSPQFIMAGTSFAYTSTLICVINAGLFCALFFGTLNGNIRSDYGLAIRIILVIQFVGTIIGTVALVSRCITSLSFREYDSRIQSEGISTEKLSEWKRNRIAFSSSDRRTSAFVQRMENFVFSLCIGLHIADFALCIRTESLFVYIYRTKFATPIAIGCKTEEETDLEIYFLYTEDCMQPSPRALERLLNSRDSLKDKAMKQQSDNILELLRMPVFVGANAIKNFDIYHVPDLGSFKLNSWSLPVVTLTCIAIVVPGISEDEINKLIDVVDEALWYTDQVEESFKSANGFENIRNTTMATVWYDVKENRKWLSNPLQRGSHGKTPGAILSKFKRIAGIIMGRNRRGDGNLRDTFANLPDYNVIAAHSMQHISGKIESRNPNYNNVQNDQFFKTLRSMIADILCACLTNIPQVIMRKCHLDDIEKLDASVEAAVKLHGRSTNILLRLQKRAEFLLPPGDMNPLERTSIDWWHRRFP